MSSVPIVQGVAVDPHQKQASAPVVVAADGYAGYHDSDPMAVPINDYGSSQQQQQYQGMLHTKQPNQFRDVFWAILFVGHFVPLVLYAIYSSATGEANNNNADAAGTPISVGPHLFWLSVTALVSVALASFSLEGMMRHADVLVKISLVFSVCFSGLIGVFGILSGQTLMAVLGFFSFAVGYVHNTLNL